MAEKYNASNIAIEQILNFIKSGEIAIPEIQRPFVWKPSQVRDLIDSLYTGYPTGYLIISQSPYLCAYIFTLDDTAGVHLIAKYRNVLFL